MYSNTSFKLLLLLALLDKYIEYTINETTL